MEGVSSRRTFLVSLAVAGGVFGVPSIHAATAPEPRRQTDAMLKLLRKFLDQVEERISGKAVPEPQLQFPADGPDTAHHLAQTLTQGVSAFLDRINNQTLSTEQAWRWSEKLLDAWDDFDQGVLAPAGLIGLLRMMPDESGRQSYAINLFEKVVPKTVWPTMARIGSTTLPVEYWKTSDRFKKRILVPLILYTHRTGIHVIQDMVEFQIHQMDAIRRSEANAPLPVVLPLQAWLESLWKSEGRNASSKIKDRLMNTLVDIELGRRLARFGEREFIPTLLPKLPAELQTYWRAVSLEDRKDIGLRISGYAQGMAGVQPDLTVYMAVVNVLSGQGQWDKAGDSFSHEIWAAYYSLVGQWQGIHPFERITAQYIGRLAGHLLSNPKGLQQSAEAFLKSNFRSRNVSRAA